MRALLPASYLSPCSPILLYPCLPCLLPAFSAFLPRVPTSLPSFLSPCLAYPASLYYVSLLSLPDCFLLCLTCLEISQTCYFFFCPFFPLQHMFYLSPASVCILFYLSPVHFCFIYRQRFNYLALSISIYALSISGAFLFSISELIFFNYPSLYNFSTNLSSSNFRVPKGRPRGDRTCDPSIRAAPRRPSSPSSESHSGKIG